MEWLAETTQPECSTIYALAALITAISGLLAVIWRRQGKLSNRQDVTENNTQTLAVASLANTVAINSSPGPNVPPAVTGAVRAIIRDPTAPVPPPARIDPIDPQQKVQT